MRAIDAPARGPPADVRRLLHRRDRRARRRDRRDRARKARSTACSRWSAHLISLAALFLLLRAEFVAAAQVVVYAGAVMVLYMFVVAYVGERRPAAAARRPAGARRPSPRSPAAARSSIELFIAVLGSGLKAIEHRRRALRAGLRHARPDRHAAADAVPRARSRSPPTCCSSPPSARSCWRAGAAASSRRRSRTTRRRDQRRRRCMRPRPARAPGTMAEARRQPTEVVDR